jgi:hypothetical protein
MLFNTGLFFDGMQTGIASPTWAGLADIEQSTLKLNGLTVLVCPDWSGWQGPAG